MIIGTFPGYVVVDTRNGFLFYRDAQGRTFDAATAASFAAEHNSSLDYPGAFCAVFRLVADAALTEAAGYRR